jgi:hypothetical protein
MTPQMNANVASRRPSRLSLSFLRGMRRIIDLRQVLKIKVCIHLRRRYAGVP